MALSKPQQKGLNIIRDEQIICFKKTKQANFNFEELLLTDKNEKFNRINTETEIATTKISTLQDKHEPKHFFTASRAKGIYDIEYHVNARN